jgi:acyl-coenzyme A thioesterase PaaI-like protein
LQKADATQVLLEQLSADTRQLIELLRCSSAPPPELESCHSHIRAAIDLLAPWQLRGSHSAVGLEPHSEFDYTPEDLTRCMPYSPISGRKNPIAPAISLWAQGRQVRGRVVFCATYAGPPDTVHGGIIAAVFDELLSMANVVNGIAGFTGSLTIKYHHGTPIDAPVELSAECIRVSGRKVISRGEMRSKGKVTAAAEGLFIKPSRHSTGGE